MLLLLFISKTGRCSWLSCSITSNLQFITGGELMAWEVQFSYSRFVFLPLSEHGFSDVVVATRQSQLWRIYACTKTSQFSSVQFIMVFSNWTIKINRSSHSAAEQFTLAFSSVLSSVSVQGYGEKLKLWHQFQSLTGRLSHWLIPDHGARDGQSHHFFLFENLDPLEA